MTSSIPQKALQTTVNQPGKVWEDFLLIAAISLFPLLYMTYRGWTNRWLVALFILTLIFALTHWKQMKTEFNDRPSQLIILTLASPFLAILFSQLLRSEININAYDGPLRFLLAALIFLYLKYKQIDFLKVFQYIAPISLLIAVGAIFYHPETSGYWNGRFATYFVDPLTFGTYALLIGFTSLFQINPQRIISPLNFLKYIGFASGLFLSLGSGSRGGWISIPVLLVLWLYLNRHYKKMIINIVILLVITVLLNVQLNNSLLHRVESIPQEIYNWLSNSENKELGSGGIRLSMWKLSLALFLENSLYGYGDVINYIRLLNEPRFSSIVGPNALHSLINGPHNEIFAQSLRSGIFGLIAGISLFFIPMGIFAQRLRKNSQNMAAQVGLAFVLGLFICSLSIEVFNLKYTTSFYALMLACLGAQTLSHD